MKLNIVTKEPDKVMLVLQELFPASIVEHTPIRPEIHSFEISEEGDPKVYSMESLMELSDFYGIPLHDIRIY